MALKIHNLAQLSRVELRILWERELGFNAPPAFGRDISILGIAYRWQERKHGGLAKSVAREIDHLLNRVLQEDSAGVKAALQTPLPRICTILVRERRGVTHHVTVVEDSRLRPMS